MIIIFGKKDDASPLCIICILFSVAIGLGILFTSMYESQISPDGERRPEFLQLGLGFFGFAILVVLCTVSICLYLKYECSCCKSGYQRV